MDASIIDSLITDRKQSDVEEVLLLKEKYENGTATAAEKNRFIKDSLKGKYSVSDIVRVESAVRFLADELVNLPKELEEYASSKDVAWSSLFSVSYDPSEFKEIITKTDWDNLGQFFGSSIAPNEYENEERYIGNIKKLTTSFEFEHEPIVSTLNRLTFYNANTLEIVLKRLYAEIQKERLRIKKYIDSVGINVFSGEYESGEIPFCQDN